MTIYVVFTMVVSVEWLGLVRLQLFQQEQSYFKKITCDQPHVGRQNKIILKSAHI